MSISSKSIRSPTRIEASRRHRWIRGDWQLAGWLLPRVPGPQGQHGNRTRSRPCRSGKFSTTCDAASSRRRSWRCSLAGGCSVRGRRCSGPLLVAGDRVPAIAIRSAPRPHSQAARARDGCCTSGRDGHSRWPPARARVVGAGLSAVRRAHLPECDPALGCADAVHATRIAALAHALLCPSQRAPYAAPSFISRCGSRRCWRCGLALAIGVARPDGAGLSCAPLLLLWLTATGHRLVDQRATAPP